MKTLDLFKKFKNVVCRVRGLVVLLVLMFACESAWATSASVTYTITSTSAVSASGTIPTSTSATFATTYTDKNQITGGKAQTLTLSGWNGLPVTNITLSMKSNASSGAGRLKYSVDGGSSWTYVVGTKDEGVAFNDAAWNNSWSDSYVNISKDISCTCTSSNFVIVLEGTVNSIFCQSYKITYTAPQYAATYSRNGITTNVNLDAPYTLPAANSESAACTGWNFVGWRTSTLASTTTRPNDFVTNATATGQTFYGVYALSDGKTGAPIGQTLLSENWTGEENNATPTGPTSGGSEVYNSATITYSFDSGNTVQTSDGPHSSDPSNVNNLIIKSNKSWTASGIPTGGATTATVSYSMSGSGTLSISSGTTNVTVGGSSSGSTITFGENVSAFDLTFSNTNGSKNLRLDDISIVVATSSNAPTYTYRTDPPCCTDIVDLDDGDPSNGTITFDPEHVATCSATASDRQTTMTITPASGYTLTDFSWVSGSGKVSPTNTSPSISTTANSADAQNITLTFGQNVDGDCVANATFDEMKITSWSWTYNSSAIPNPLDIYVGQKKQIDVVMSPSGVLSSHKDNNSYSHSADLTYIGNPTRAGAYFTFEGKAATSSTTITLTHDDDNAVTPTFAQMITVRVNALPQVTFIDIMHGLTSGFTSDGNAVPSSGIIVATVSGDKWTVTTTKKTPVHDDVDDPGSSYNTCERGHLHLVGWIEQTWAEAHLDATHAEIVGANASAGAGTYYAAGANIDLETENGKTYYAVWSKTE